jgi:hypothetical protein
MLPEEIARFNFFKLGRVEIYKCQETLRLLHRRSLLLSLTSMVVCCWQWWRVSPFLGEVFSKSACSPKRICPTSSPGRGESWCSQEPFSEIRRELLVRKLWRRVPGRHGTWDDTWSIRLFIFTATLVRENKKCRKQSPRQLELTAAIWR